MRIRLTIALALGATTATASAQKPKPIDVSAELETMAFYHDGQGHYLAMWTDGKNKRRYYYGNGKRFYKNTIYAGGKRKGGFYANFRDPRVVEASLTLNGPTGTATCKPTYDVGNETKTKLTRLEGPARAKLASRAKFFEKPFRRVPHALARDAMGIYYYVDHMERIGNRGERRDFRLYIGTAGAMKRVKLTSTASDSIGEVFATKTGALQVRWGHARNRSRAVAFAWVKPNRKDKIDLTNVPADINGRLIFSQLRVYGAVRYGTHCDDL